MTAEPLVSARRGAPADSTPEALVAPVDDGPADRARTEAGSGPGPADVDRLLRDRSVLAVFQPVVSMTDGAIMGYEALARMTAPGTWAPDRWLAAAEQHGRRRELERLCLGAAIGSGLPPGQARLFVNLSPSLLGDPEVRELLAGIEDRIVLELSESQIIHDYDQVRDDVMAWLARGAELAIDDTGSGYASLRHVLQLCPDFIKLDRSLVDGIERDRNRQALMNAMVAFASTLGASVIAEGVELPGELEVLRSAGVGFVQGYLLARPGPAWPAAADPSPRPARVTGAGPTPSVGAASHDELAARLASASGPRSACEVVVDHLAGAHGLLPSAYLLAGDRLRCQAQRGLWQILDGLQPGAGITGQCYVEGRDIVVDDVSRSRSYLEAIPGVRSEVCVPIRVEGVVVGALNAESRAVIGEVELDAIRQCADLLGDRLATVGRTPLSTPYDRLGFHLRLLSAARTPEQVRRRLAHAAQETSGLDSALVTVVGPRGEDRAFVAGPLRHALGALGRAELARLAAVVEGMTSCYTAGTTVDHGLIHLAALRRTGVRALVVVPLLAGDERLGLLVVANSTPCAFAPAEIEPLELLAGHAALALHATRLGRGSGGAATADYR